MQGDALHIGINEIICFLYLIIFPKCFNVEARNIRVYLSILNFPH